MKFFNNHEWKKNKKALKFQNYFVQPTKFYILYFSILHKVHNVCNGNHKVRSSLEDNIISRFGDDAS